MAVGSFADSPNASKNNFDPIVRSKLAEEQFVAGRPQGVGETEAATAFQKYAPTTTNSVNQAYFSASLSASAPANPPQNGANLLAASVVAAVQIPARQTDNLTASAISEVLETSAVLKTGIDTYRRASSNFGVRTSGSNNASAVIDGAILDSGDGESSFVLSFDGAPSSAILKADTTPVSSSSLSSSEEGAIDARIETESSEYFSQSISLAA